MVSKAFTALNVLVLLFVTVSGCIKGDTSNWKLREDDLPQATAHEAGYEGLHSPCAAFRVGWESISQCFIPGDTISALLRHCVRDKALSPAGLKLWVVWVGWTLQLGPTLGSHCTDPPAVPDSSSSSQEPVRG